MSREALTCFLACSIHRGRRKGWSSDRSKPHPFWLGPEREGPPMGQSTADRTLLFGYLALQMDFITSPSLVSAMNAWALAKDKTLGQVLVSRGDLAEDDDALIEALARRIIEKHENNPRRSLEAVTAGAAVPPELEQIADDDLGYSVRMLPNRGETTWPPIGASRPCADNDRSSRWLALPPRRFPCPGRHGRGLDCRGYRTPSARGTQAAPGALRR